MKKILFILLALVFLAVLALVIFIATFDLNRFRPVITQKLEEALGNPVRIGHSSLGWQDGLSLEIRELEILKPEGEQGETAVMRLERANANLNFFSFLKNRDVQIGSIFLLALKVHLVRSPEGELSVVGINPKKKSSGSGAITLPFLVDRVKVQDGEFYFTDLTQKPPVRMELEDFDLELRHVSLFRPVDFEARASLASPEQNIFVKGLFQIPVNDRPALLKDVSVSVDLNNLQIEELERMLPGWPVSTWKDSIAGRISLETGELRLDKEGLAHAAARAKIVNGRFALPGIAAPLENIQASAVWEGNQIRLEDFSTALAQGTLKAQGAANGITTANPQTQFQFQAERIVLGSLLPAPDPEAPQLKGTFSASFQGRAAGMSAPAILQSLSGDGRIAMADGVILNLNLIQKVFEGMSILPGLVNTLRQRLPPEYEEKLNARDTYLGPLDLPLAVRQGAVFFQDVPIVTDTFQLTASGSYRFDGWVQCRAMLKIDPTFSAALYRSVQELEYLADPEGRLEIPVLIQGPVTALRILPDLTYVAARLAVTRVQDMIGGFMQRRAPAGTAPQDPNASGTPTGQNRQPAGGLLGTLLGTGSGSQPTDTTSPQNQTPPLQDLLGTLFNQSKQNEKETPDSSSGSGA